MLSQLLKSSNAKNLKPVLSLLPIRTHWFSTAAVPEYLLRCPETKITTIPNKIRVASEVMIIIKVVFIRTFSNIRCIC